jgi:glycosyltransferase involved in cell wall biosynthesis
MPITLVVPVKNDAARLKTCLDSIARTAGSAAPEVVVADNGSTDRSPAVAAEAGARVLSVPNVPVGELRNIAARTATGSVLAFVDADHELEPGWFEAAAESFEDSGVGAAGALYLSPRDGTWVQRMYGALRGRTTGRSETGWLGSGNMLVRRDIFERLAGFDTRLEACEDVDLCRRIRAGGWKIIGDERFRSVHHGDPKTLRALFRAELWRGRDNLRVSFRSPFDPRDLPSIITPMVGLAIIPALILGLFGAGWALRASAIGFVFLVGVIAIRTARMTLRLGDVSPVAGAQALAVAVTYEVARAVALVFRAPHHRR